MYSTILVTTVPPPTVPAAELAALRQGFDGLNLRHATLWTDRNYVADLVTMFRQRTRAA